MESASAKTGSKKISKRIMIVDDHATTRLGLKQLIGSEPNLEVCGEASSVTEALQQLGDLEPDLVLIDISLKNGSGLDLIEQIRRQYPGTKMLVASMHNESLYADRALQAGAMGYICKDEAVQQVVEAIRRILSGKIYLSENMSERILRRRMPLQASGEDSFTDALSNRELEVFQLIGEGQTRSQLAKSLHLSVKTIETHQENIKKKLNLKSNQEMVCRAVEWVLENKKNKSVPVAND